MIFADRTGNPAAHYPCITCGKNLPIHWDGLIGYVQIECARLGWELPVRWTFSIPHEDHAHLAQLRLGDDVDDEFEHELNQEPPAHEGRTELKANPFS